MDSTAGRLVGIPTIARTYNFTIRVIDVLDLKVDKTFIVLIN